MALPARGGSAVVECDDFAPVDRHPVAGLQVGPERLGDQPFVGRRLRPLQLVEMGKLRPGDDGVPQPHSRVPGGRIDQNRPEKALPVGEEHRRHPVAVGIDHPLVIGHHLVAGRGIGDRLVDEAGLETEFFEKVAGDSLFVRFVAVDVQCPARTLVPGFDVGHRPAAQQCTDAHHRPAVRPLPLPRVLLALLAVDLLEAEEAPVHREAGQVTHLADPQRRLVRVRAHDVEVEVDGLGASGSHREPQVAGGALTELVVALPADRAGVDLGPADRCVRRRAG